MGNEKSQPSGLVVDETATEVTDSWSLHGATYVVGSVPKISVFIGVPQSTAIEKFAKNIMVHRHPCILKYVGSWKKGGKFYLATEQVQPLTQVLSSQTALQICVGLQSILKALVFLHDCANSSHNNVCRAAIYVTQGGSWKLGGLEYLCRFNEVTSSYLAMTRSRRYDPAVAPGESDRIPQPAAAIDCYAFGILAQEVLAGQNHDEVPSMTEFVELCKKQLQNADCVLRPTLSSLLEHNFFTHQFIAIHNFLVDLPIKTDTEKQDFFRDLTQKLSAFPEEIVASQFGSLLLSRMVLLDATAQQHLLPQVFTPRIDGSTDSLFSGNTFRTHMVPRLLPLFCVRDIQIRMILLSHFSAYCSLFSQNQLQTRVLPELLVGIKDTNDILVSCTLRALAELVPILGSSVVIGGKRKKLFADGRPKAVKHAAMRNNSRRNKTKTTINTDTVIMNGDSEIFLSERPSPDGGEDFTTPIASEEEETWPDWDNTVNEDSSANVNAVPQLESSVVELTIDPTLPASKALKPASAVNQAVPPKSTAAKATMLADLESLDVKATRSLMFPSSSSQEIDFFQDMEPVISKPCIVQIQEQPNKPRSKFELVDGSDAVDGWGDDFDAWDDVDGDSAQQTSTSVNKNSID